MIAAHFEVKKHAVRQTADGCELCCKPVKAAGRQFCSRTCAIRYRVCRSDADRLHDRSALNPETGCIEWTGCRNAKGYGETGIPTLRGAHRLAYKVHFGDFPRHLHILHHCDNPACVTPEHLFIGTNHDNVADKVAKGRASSLKGEAQGRAKLTDEIVRWIRGSNESLRSLSRKFGVSKFCIWQARKGRSWKHVQ